MSRLRHQLKGYLLALRMTQVQTVVFIEGAENDPVFYDEICRRYSKETGRKTQIRFANELPNAALPDQGGAGGKAPLIRAAKFLERWRGTGSSRRLPGKEIAFCVDKDADDVLGLLVNCPAVVYTLLHSTENHIVSGSDLQKAICTAISATAQSLNEEIGGCDQLRRLSHNWRDWVIYCLVSLRLNISRSGTYRQESPFNSPAHNSPDHSAVQLKFEEARRVCGFAEERFESELRQITELVDQLIIADQFDAVFKGRWYVSILYSLLKNTATFGSRCRTCGKNGLWIGIRSTFALDEVSYRHYAGSFARLR
jgi:hypothetical protein